MVIVILSAVIEMFNIQVEGESIFWYAQLIQTTRKIIVFSMVIICGMGAGAARWEKIEERFEKIRKGEKNEKRQ